MHDMDEPIATEHVITDAKFAIYHYTSKRRDPVGKTRTPPLMIAAHFRSGKTTTIEKLYNSLIADSKVLPIFITFNGISDFKRLPGETDLDGFLRVLATELISIPPGGPIKCSPKVLEQYFSTANKPIVLLVRTHILNCLVLALCLYVYIRVHSHFLVVRYVSLFVPFLN